MSNLRVYFDRSSVLKVWLEGAEVKVNESVSISLCLLVANNYYDEQGKLVPNEVKLIINKVADENKFEVSNLIFSDLEEFDALRLKLYSDKKLLSELNFNWPDLNGEKEVVIPLTPSGSRLIELEANAGEAQKVKEGTKVELDGSQSMVSDGSDLIYLWQQTEGPIVNILDNSNPTPNFDAPNLSAGVNELAVSFNLTIKDAGNSVSDTDTVTIVVERSEQLSTPPINPVPSVIADAGEDQVKKSASKVVLDASKSYSINGGSISFQWSQRSGQAVELSNYSSSNPIFDAPSLPKNSNTEILTFSVNVSDQTSAAFGEDTVNVKIEHSDVVGPPPSRPQWWKVIAALLAVFTVLGIIFYDQIFDRFGLSKLPVINACNSESVVLELTKLNETLSEASTSTIQSFSNCDRDLLNSLVLRAKDNPKLLFELGKLHDPFEEESNLSKLGIIAIRDVTLAIDFYYKSYQGNFSTAGDLMSLRCASLSRDDRALVQNLCKNF